MSENQTKAANVRDFRLPEDADDTAAMRRAADFASSPAGNGRVYLPPGTYHTHGEATTVLDAIRELFCPSET